MPPKQRLHPSYVSRWKGFFDIYCWHLLDTHGIFRPFTKTLSGTLLLRDPSCKIAHWVAGIFEKVHSLLGISLPTKIFRLADFVSANQWLNLGAVWSFTRITQLKPSIIFFGCNCCHWSIFSLIKTPRVMFGFSGCTRKTCRNWEYLKFPPT